MTRMIFYPQYYKKAPKLNTEIQSKIQAISKEGSEEHQIVIIPGTLDIIEYKLEEIVKTHQENIKKSQTIYILHTEADSPTIGRFRGWVNILRDRIIAHAPANRSGRKIETTRLGNTVASRAAAAAAPPKPIAPPQPTHPYSVIEAIPSKQDLGAKTPLLSQPSHSKNCKTVCDPCACTIQ
jgi:hypothetical protein